MSTASTDAGRSVLVGMVVTPDGWPVPHAMVTVVDETGRQSGRGAVGRLDTGLAHEPSASTLRARPI